MRALVKILRSRAFAWLVISALVFGGVAKVRARGWLQRPELAVYDDFLRRQSDPKVTDERIVICGMTEQDLVKYGHPLNDDTLADLLEKLVAAEPCVIGLDMYRDHKEPRSGEFYPKLAAVLQKHERIIAIERLESVKAPPALADHLERVAPNNLPCDYAIDRLFRRAYLFLENRLPEPRESFALSVAHGYLLAQNAAVQLTESNPPLLQLGKVAIPRLTPDAGNYENLSLGDYEMLIDFRGPQQFSRITFDEVLRRPPLGWLRGKIVLISSATMDSVKDTNPTPLDPSFVGVYEHAIIINQLLRAGLEGVAPTRWWPEPAELAWIALFTLLGGALGLVFRSPWRLAPALGLLMAAVGGAGYVALGNGVWIPIAAPALGCFLAATFVTSFMVYREREERGTMQHLFSRHVSPGVVKALWAEREQFLAGGRLKPQRVTATVLFTDLKGFSTTSEKMDPATLMEWMNEYMNGVARHVDLHGGIINKYIGDAIMAVFGVPIARTKEPEIDRDAIHAVECALEMRAALTALNADWKSRDLPTTAMRIGIYTGPLVAGSFGSEERLEFTVLGDTVNTAARLEAAGKDAGDDSSLAECVILIGDSTFQRLGSRFVTRPLGPIKLKGKSEEIIVHSVVSVSAE